MTGKFTTLESKETSVCIVFAHEAVSLCVVTSVTRALSPIYR